MLLGCSRLITVPLDVAEALRPRKRIFLRPVHRNQVLPALASERNSQATRSELRPGCRGRAAAQFRVRNSRRFGPRGSGLDGGSAEFHPQLASSRDCDRGPVASSENGADAATVPESPCLVARSPSELHRSGPEDSALRFGISSVALC